MTTTEDVVAWCLTLTFFVALPAISVLVALKWTLAYLDADATAFGGIVLGLVFLACLWSLGQSYVERAALSRKTKATFSTSVTSRAFLAFPDGRNRLIDAGDLTETGDFFPAERRASENAKGPDAVVSVTTFFVQIFYGKGAKRLSRVMIDRCRVGYDGTSRCNFDSNLVVVKSVGKPDWQKLRMEDVASLDAFLDKEKVRASAKRGDAIRSAGRTPSCAIEVARDFFDEVSSYDERPCTVLYKKYTTYAPGYVRAEMTRTKTISAAAGVK